MSLMPIDQNNPLFGILNPGAQGGGVGNIGGMMNRGPSWIPQGQGFGGQQSGLRGLLSDPNFALALLANSGGGPRRSFGQVLGQSALQAQQMGQQSQDAELDRQYRLAQIQALQTPKGASVPASVQEYEYAKQNGYTGSFQEWIAAGGQTSRPSSVQEWEFFDKLPAEAQRRYLEMKRNPNWKVGEVNQIPTVIQGTPGGGVETTPLSNLPAVAASAETVKQAEGRGGAVGKTQGEITGGILTKGSNATTVLDMTKEARSLLDKSTGSLGGTALDRTLGAFGVSTGGAQAGAQLKVLQAGLMTNMPRMEGPQSDADVRLYQQAAAQIGDTTIPVETRKAALDTIDALQKKYQERASDAAPSSPAAPQQSLDDIRKKYGRKP